MKTVVKMTPEECRSFERVWYERRSLMNLIDYFVSLCTEPEKSKLLGSYINEYKHDLEIATAHEIILREEITKNHLSEDDYRKLMSGAYRYWVNFDEMEVVYCNGQC